MDYQQIFMTPESIIRLASKSVKHKFYNDQEISNYAKSQPLYRKRLRESILQIKELIELNNQLCEA